MTVIINQASGPVKNEISVLAANNIHITRIIDARIYTMLVSNHSPISIEQLHRFCLFDNNMFKMLSMEADPE